MNNLEKYENGAKATSGGFRLASGAGAFYLVIARLQLPALS
jgi:hypothetical protein